MVSSLDQAKISEAGQSILDDSEKMYQSLAKVKSLVDASKSYFDSDAGNDLRSKFNASAEKFDEFKNFLKTYGEFLKTFSGNVVKFEDAVSDAIDDLPKL